MLGLQRVEWILRKAFCARFNTTSRRQALLILLCLALCVVNVVIYQAGWVGIRTDSTWWMRAKTIVQAFCVMVAFPFGLHRFRPCHSHLHDEEHTDSSINHEHTHAQAGAEADTTAQSDWQRFCAAVFVSDSLR